MSRDIEMNSRYFYNLLLISDDQDVSENDAYSSICLCCNFLLSIRYESSSFDLVNDIINVFLNFSGTAPCEERIFQISPLQAETNYIFRFTAARSTHSETPYLSTELWNRLYLIIVLQSWASTLLKKHKSRIHDHSNMFNETMTE